MEFDAMSIFTAWLGLFSISFTFLPVGLVLDWRRRGTSFGFSSIQFVLGLTIQCCWIKHGLLTNDNTNIIINSVNIVASIVYLLAFAYYHPKRQYLLLQVFTAICTVGSVYWYVDSQDEKLQPDLMGSIAATAQILSLSGGIYEIFRAISMGHTEYIPASFQFAIFFLILQWLAFGILTGNQFIAYANAAGLVVNLVTISLYFVYPPLTWRVPLIGTGPQQKKKE